MAASGFWNTPLRRRPPAPPHFLGSLCSPLSCVATLPFPASVQTRTLSLPSCRHPDRADRDCGDPVNVYNYLLYHSPFAFVPILSLSSLKSCSFLFARDHTRFFRSLAQSHHPVGPLFAATSFFNSDLFSNLFFNLLRMPRTTPLFPAFLIKNEGMGSLPLFRSFFHASAGSPRN